MTASVSAFWLGTLAEGGADDLGAEGITAGGVEGFAAVELQVGRQRKHEEPIDGRNGEAIRFVRPVAGAAEFAKLLNRGRRSAHVLVHVDPEPQVTQQKQRLLRADQMCVLQ